MPLPPASNGDPVLSWKSHTLLAWSISIWRTMRGKPCQSCQREAHGGQWTSCRFHEPDPGLAPGESGSTAILKQNYPKSLSALNTAYSATNNLSVEIGLDGLGSFGDRNARQTR